MVSVSISFVNYELMDSWFSGLVGSAVYWFSAPVQERLMVLCVLVLWCLNVLMLYWFSCLMVWWLMA